MRRIIYILWGVMLIITLLMVACSPSAASTPQQTEEATQPSAATEAPQPTDAEEQTELTETEASISPEGAREDIPIMEGARELQALRGGTTIVYTIDTDIETAVDFYVEELPKNGWELAGPPDSAVGSIAAMLRENDSGDRMTINMQENQLGGFVRVTISVVRAH